MALVRCPKHKIPYNEENPRGCPACAREKDEAGRSSAIQELARVSQQARRPSAAPQKATAPPGRVTRPSSRQPFPITQPPKHPAVEQGRLEKLLDLGNRRRLVTTSIAAIALVALIVILTSRPRFMEGLYPVRVDESDVRPLPLNPNAPIQVAFAALGAKPAGSNPDSPRVTRYSYGSDLTIDAINGIIYAVTLRVPNRSWRGIHVGMDQQTAEGNLALLGNPIEAELSSPDPQLISGFVAYRSLDDRPRRTLLAEVRPPNGCFDVLVDVQPQAIGLLQNGDQRFAVVGREGGAVTWVVTRIRAVSRSISGPYAAGPGC